jgi:hypothetical protein
MQVGDLILNGDGVFGIITDICESSPQPYKCKWFKEKYTHASFLTRLLGLEYRQRYAMLEAKTLDRKFL